MKKTLRVALLCFVLTLFLPVVSMACGWICSGATTLPNGETREICLWVHVDNLSPMCFEGELICWAWYPPCSGGYVPV
jgi:hypothetical protein